MKDYKIFTEHLGVLTMEYVLIFYEYPRSFICSSGDGNFYLLNEYDSDVSSYTWVACLIDSFIIARLNQSLINIPQAFALSSKLYKITSVQNNKISNVELIESLPSDTFEDAVEYVGDFIPKTSNEHIQRAISLSEETGNPSITFAYNNRSSNHACAPYSLICSLAEKLMSTGKIIVTSLKKENLIVAMSNLSTVIHFEIENPKKWQPDLQDASNLMPSAKIVETIQNLSTARTEEDLIKSANGDKDLIVKYAEMISSSTKNGDIEIICCSDKGKKHSSSVFNKKISKSLLVEAKKIANNSSTNVLTSQFVAYGCLKGLLKLDNRTFQFFDDVKNKIYRGVASVELIEKYNDVLLSDKKRLKATILEKKMPSGKIDYLLQNLEEAGDFLV